MWSSGGASQRWPISASCPLPHQGASRSANPHLHPHHQHTPCNPWSHPIRKLVLVPFYSSETFNSDFKEFVHSYTASDQTSWSLSPVLSDHMVYLHTKWAGNSLAVPFFGGFSFPSVLCRPPPGPQPCLGHPLGLSTTCLLYNQKSLERRSLQAFIRLVVPRPHLPFSSFNLRTEDLQGIDLGDRQAGGALLAPGQTHPVKAHRVCG